jgi:hypothetical protein
VTSHALEGALPLGQVAHAAETDADLGMLLEPKQACSHCPIPAAPAAARGVWWLEVVPTNRCPGHARSLAPTISFRSDATLP